MFGFYALRDGVTALPRGTQLQGQITSAGQARRVAGVGEDERMIPVVDDADDHADKLMHCRDAEKCSIDV